MAHSGNHFALAYRDRMVGRAMTASAVMKAFNRGDRVRTASFHFAGNLVLGAVPQTLAGIGVLPPYPIAAFRGWVGGIVSVDGNHHSRLADRRQRYYYLSVFLLQFVPYCLTGGAGVHLGLSWYRNLRTSGFHLPWKLPLARTAIPDVLRIYSRAAPLFLAASFFEFLAPSVNEPRRPRVPPSTRRPAARQIVEKHQGAIRVRSKVGKGTVFRSSRPDLQQSGARLSLKNCITLRRQPLRYSASPAFLLGSSR